MSKSYWMENQDGNFTNNKEDAFDPKKRIIGKRLQQGVPFLDRDWNEFEDIRRYEEQMLRKHYIGNGTPDDGFRISACVPPDNNFKIGAGRCLVDGFEAVNEPPEQKQYIYYTDQSLEALTSPIDTEERVDTVYLDVWIKEVRSLKTASEEEKKDPDRIDESLGNIKDIDIETCVGHRLVWRVRVDEGSKEEYLRKIDTNATVREDKYKFEEWGQYPVIGLLPDAYCPLSNDPNKFAKLIIDDDSMCDLKTGDKLDLGQGYYLAARQVDVDGKKVWLELYKDGQCVDDQIISTDSGDHTWTCKLDNVQGEDDVPVLKVHVSQVFQDAVDSIAQIDGVWLIDYKKAFKQDPYHHYYDIARIKRKKGVNEILDADITDLRDVNGKALSRSIEEMLAQSVDLNRIHKVPLLRQTLFGRMQKTLVEVGESPMGVAFDGTHIWVANVLGNSVSKIDIESNEVVNVPLEASPEGIAFDGTHIWVTNSSHEGGDKNCVKKINIKNNEVVKTVPLETSPHGIVFDGTYIWVTTVSGNDRDKNDSVKKIDIQRNEVIGSVLIGDSYGIAFDGTHIWVSNFYVDNDGQEHNSIKKIDIKSSVVVASVPMRSKLSAIAFDGTHIWVGGEGNSYDYETYNSYVSKININSNKEVASVFVGDFQSPKGIAFDGTHIWVTPVTEKPPLFQVIKIDINTNKVLETIYLDKEGTGGGTGGGIAFDGTYLWVAKSDENYVVKIKKII